MVQSSRPDVVLIALLEQASRSLWEGRIEGANHSPIVSALLPIHLWKLDEHLELLGHENVPTPSQLKKAWLDR